MPNILITGGSGLIGKHLTALLFTKGYSVGHLTRKAKHLKNGAKQFLWDVDRGIIDNDAISWADYIIHLAGESIGQRWTKETQQIILASRVNSTALLSGSIQQGHNIKAFISASAIGYYGGDTKDVILSESSPSGNDFLAEVVVRWENAVDQVAEKTERVVKMRTGIVLAHGGALAKMITPIRLGVGSALGTGKQWMSWIHIDDLCNMFLYAIENPLTGSYNAVSPNPTTNLDFTRLLASQLKRPLFMPNVPSFVLKLLLGKMSVLVLGGNRVVPTAFLKEKFTYKYERLNNALASLV